MSHCAENIFDIKYIASLPLVLQLCLIAPLLKYHELVPVFKIHL